jgi:2-polyprenyl-3-methyl-5-hydroxy-6-metoxy-1,4-benzoquinol methylase
MLNHDFKEIFWKSYSENHFWRLNDKTKVKENSIYYDDLYDTLLPKDKASRILDVGCGGGHFLYYLIRKGYTNIEGVDLAPGLVEFVKNEICGNVRNREALNFLEENQAVFNVIVANDFIEHLSKESIIKFLFLAKISLKTDGMLIIKTPNMSHLFASRNRYVDFTHEVGFTEHSLYEVCAAANYDQVEIYSEFHSTAEPRFFKILRKLYSWVRENPPNILSTNLIAVCIKKTSASK